MFHEVKISLKSFHSLDPKLSSGLVSTALSPVLHRASGPDLSVCARANLVGSSCTFDYQRLCLSDKAVFWDSIQKDEHENFFLFYL